jgi:hypothetical protein
MNRRSFRPSSRSSALASVVSVLCVAASFAESTHRPAKSRETKDRAAPSGARAFGDFLIFPGQCVEEQLAPPDELIDDISHFDRYQLDWPGGDLIVTMTSAVVDAYLIVIDPMGTQLPDVDSFIGGSETFVFNNAPAGTYFIFATSFALETGPYSLCVDPAFRQAERMVDGGFEAAAPNPAWQPTSTNFGTPICSIALCGDSNGQALPRTGNKWSWFGGIDGGVNEAGSVQQSVTIPDEDIALLTFYLWNGASSGNGFDSLRVKIDGVQIFSAITGNPLYTSDYARAILDVSSFADGQTHTIRIEASVSGSALTNFSVDDVSLRTFPRGAELGVTPAELTPTITVGQDAADQTIDVANVGAGAIDYTVEDNVAWLSVTPAGGSSSGETDTLTVEYSTSGLAVGMHQATIAISSLQAVNSPRTVVVNLTVNDPTPTQPRIGLSATAFERTIAEGQFAPGHAFTIANTGGGTLNYTVADNATWLAVDVAAGASTGEEDAVLVSYDSAGLNPGTYEATITVAATGAIDTPRTIAVTLTVGPLVPMRVIAPGGDRSWEVGSIVSVNWSFDPIAGRDFRIELREIVENILIPMTGTLTTPMGSVNAKAQFDVPTDAPAGIYVVRVTSLFLENNPGQRPGGVYFAEGEAFITIPSIFPGESIQGELTQFDTMFSDGVRFDLYAFFWPGGDLAISQSSVEIDSFLVIEDALGNSTAVNNGFGSETEIYVQLDAPRGGYVILATSADVEFGFYTLTLGNPPPSPAPAVDLDFRVGGSPHGWTGGALPGLDGTTSVGANGLCMTVAADGLNGVGWFSPANLVPLMDRAVYRLRASISTTQTAVDAIPLFFFLYANQQDDFFQSYGGERWVWDASGAAGAAGIGRLGGLSEIEFYFGPISMDAPSWRTNNDLGGTAFSAEADSINDMRLFFRVLDLAGGADPLSAADDFGTICISDFEVTALPLSLLRAAATNVYAPPLDDGSNAPGVEDPRHPQRTHFAQTQVNLSAFPTIEADIIDGTWRVKLPGIDGASDPLSLGFVRATLGPDVVSAG